jgi:hypothetical protein
MGSRLSGSETISVSLVAMLATAIVAAYFSDWLGLHIVAVAILPLAAGAGAATLVALRRQTRWDAGETFAFVGVIGAVFVWLLWMARPDFLPLGSGSDLTHHVLLIDYIEAHWRLVHDPAAEAYLGEMVHYTPGSHLLAALAASWTGSDGLHSIHWLVALSVALKAGFVVFVSRRLLPPGSPQIPLAASGVVLLLIPHAFFLGSFIRDSFLAQVIAELFAVAMWWALVVWDERPWRGALAIVALAGAAAFLTWPLWVGPPMAVLVMLVLFRDGLTVRERLISIAWAAGPIAIVAAAHIAGRTEWISIVRSSGAVTRPWPSAVGWWFLVLSGAGLILTLRMRRGRATGLLLAAIGAQALALLWLAMSAGAETPYAALKMAHLALYPLAAAGTVAVATIWKAAALAAASVRPPGASQRLAERAIAWILVAALGVVAGGRLVAAQRARPVITESTYLAGKWARAHVPPGCVDYLVDDANTAYWLHLSVLGNPRMSARAAADDTYDPHQARGRWVYPAGLPFAIVENLAELPNDIASRVTVLARFGPAAVVQRVGQSSCPEDGR